MAKAVEELKLSQSGLLDEKTAIKVGKLTSAKYLVVGSYQMAEGDILMNARLIDVESGGVQQTTRVKGSFKNIFDLQNLAKNTLTWMNVTPVETDVKKMQAAPVRNVTILEFLSRARQAFYAGRTDESEEWIKKALIEDPADPESIMLQGWIQERRGQYETALSSYTSSADISKRRNDEKSYSKGLRNIGYVLYRQGRNDEALQYYNRSLDISRKISYEEGVAAALSGIGGVYHAQADTMQRSSIVKRA